MADVSPTDLALPGALRPLRAHGSRGGRLVDAIVPDEAALEAGWEMTMTEHLCPACMLAVMPGDRQWQVEPRAFAKVIEVAR